VPLDPDMCTGLIRRGSVHGLIRRGAVHGLRINRKREIVYQTFY
jgi:hypothetical protein